MSYRNLISLQINILHFFFSLSPTILPSFVYLFTCSFFLLSSMSIARNGNSWAYMRVFTKRICVHQKLLFRILQIEKRKTSVEGEIGGSTWHLNRGQCGYFIYVIWLGPVRSLRHCFLFVSDNGFFL